MLVVQMQKTRIDLLLLDLALCHVRTAFFHHYAGNSDVRVPDGEVEDRSSLRKSEQVLAFKGLCRVVVEYLHHLHTRVLVINQHIDVHHLE